MRLALTALLILLSSACASALPQQPSLEVVVSEYFAASKLADVSASEGFLAPEHLFIGPSGKIQDRALRVSWLGENGEWLPTVETRDIVVRDLGQTGLVTGIWVIPDNGKTVYERFLHVWTLQDGRWQMISHQVTEMASP